MAKFKARDIPFGPEFGTKPAIFAALAAYASERLVVKNAQALLALLEMNGEIEHGVSEHCMLVANELAESDASEISVAVAVLHDVVEDSKNISREKLIKLIDSRVSPLVADGVQLLSRVENETYAQYIDRIVRSENIFAVEAKCADMRHNIARCKEDERYASLLRRYDKYLPQLEGRLAELRSALPPKHVI